MSNTVIALRSSGTATNTPNPLNLEYGELALNYADGILYYRTTSDTLGSILTTEPAGLSGEIQFNDSGSLGSSANLYFNTSTQSVEVRSVLYNQNVKTYASSYTTVDTSQVTVDSFSTSSYRSVKYLTQLSSGSEYHMIELSVVHDDSTVYLAQYGEVKTGNTLGSFDATISTGTLNLLFTPTNSSTIVKLYGNYITI